MFRKKKLLLIVGLLAGFVLLVVLTTNQVSAPFLQKNNESGPENSPTATQPTFDKNKFSTTDPASNWVVVNKTRPLNPLEYVPSDLTDIGNGHRLSKETADALSQLVRAAKNDGHTIAGLSGYRSYERQKVVYQNEVKTYGQATADTQSAKPGFSEHQTGLAVDVGGGGCNIDDCFGTTAEGKWVAANAYKYGFIIRYPEGKDAVTGYRYEPWHLRYVGTELATEMYNKNIQTLEEFFEL